MLNWSGFFFSSHWGLSNCLLPSGRFPRVLPPSLSPPPHHMGESRVPGWPSCLLSGPGSRASQGSRIWRRGLRVLGCLAGQVLRFPPPSPAQPTSIFLCSSLNPPFTSGPGQRSQCHPSGPSPVSLHQHVPGLTGAIITGPPLARSYCLPRCPLLFSPWSSAIAFLSGTPTLGFILRTPGPFQADACEDVCPSGQTPGWTWPWPLALKLTWPFLRLHLLRMTLVMCAHPLVMRMKWHHRSQWTLGPGSTMVWVTSQRFYWGLHLSHALKPSHTTPGSWALLSLHIFIIELHGTYLLSRRFWKAGAFAVWVIIFHNIKQCLAPDECQ